MKLIDYYSRKENILNKDVNVYLCGPTPYDHSHIGNVRPVIVFDVLNRVFRARNYKFNYVHNFTDIDDKIIDSALKLNLSEAELSKKFISSYQDVLKKLNIIFPNYQPLVSENIEGMIKFIEKLIKLDYAYINNGNVYFSINKWEKYINKVNIKMDELITSQHSLGDKFELNDFVLWKKTDKGIQFDSPFGKGRPGWHTECSYFIEKYFGNYGIDIHGGGIDLRFPHHVNESAQYEAIHNVSLANNWLYIGHVNYNFEKMSKSIGNIIYANEFIDKYSANVLRMLFLLNYYTKPINFNTNVISNAQNQIKKIQLFLDKNSKSFDKAKFEKFSKILDEEFISILENKLNTPNAITYLMEQIKKLNKTFNLEEYFKFISNLNILGFNFKN